MPCWQGEGTAQVSWRSGFGHVPLVQFRSWSRPAREAPPPRQREPLPQPGPSTKRADPRPASSGTPAIIHQDPPAPPQGNGKKAGNGARRPARRAVARGPLPGPDPRGRLRAQAGAPRPPRPETAARARPRGTRGGGLTGAWEAQPDGPAQGRGPGARAVLAASAPTAAAPWSIPARLRPGAARSRRAATPDQQPQRAGSGERPAPGA